MESKSDVDVAVGREKAVTTGARRKRPSLILAMLLFALVFVGLLTGGYYVVVPRVVREAAYEARFTSPPQMEQAFRQRILVETPIGENFSAAQRKLKRMGFRQFCGIAAPSDCLRHFQYRVPFIYWNSTQYELWAVYFDLDDSNDVKSVRVAFGQESTF